MHRTFEISVSSHATDQLIEQLAALEDVIGLSLQRGASIKPEGDVITVHALNRSADEVLRCVAALPSNTSVSIATGELTSLSDPENNESIDNDVDEALWEEMETGVRHQGRLTSNYLALMALGGALASIGLISERVPQAICFISASIIAPGFEPIAKIPLGLLLRHPHRWKRGLVSSLAGYAVLMLASAAMFGVLLLGHETSAHELIENSQVKMMRHPHLPDLLQSACAAVAGVVIIAAYRRSVIAGALAALTIIPAAALVGAAAIAGQGEMALAALRRTGIDVLFIIGAGLLVFGLKQATTHSRRRLPFEEPRGKVQPAG